MGDRVSILFSNNGQNSVVLFSHWDGVSLVSMAKQYAASLRRQAKISGSMFPLYRLEPETVMVDFIRHLTEIKNLKSVTGNYYLGATQHDGDNSDNGHYVINLAATDGGNGEREVEFFYCKSHKAPALRRLLVKGEDSSTISGIDSDCKEYRCFLKSRILNGKIFEICSE